MSLWNNFLDNIAKPAGKVIGQSVDYWKEIITGSLSPSQAISNVVIPAGVQIGASPMLSALNVEEKAQQAIKDNLVYSVKSQSVSNDLVLKAGVKLHDEVISPYMTRPFSALGLVTDTNSPLYQADEFEKGFQVKDLLGAYKRSEEVSIGQAWTKSDFNLLRPLQDIVFEKGGLNIDEIDLWNNDDIQAAFVDNPYGKYWTGGFDFVAGNIAVAKGFGLISKAGKLALKGVGLNTKNVSHVDLDKDISDGILFNVSKGAQGKETVRGELIMKLAESKDANYVVETLGKLTNNADLIKAVLSATDPYLVKDLIMADKGYLPSLQRLATDFPKDLYEIKNMNTYFKNHVIETGRLPEINDIGWERINAAMEDAIKAVPEHRALKDSLLDPEYGMTVKLGKDYAPMEPKFGLGKNVLLSMQKLKQGSSVQSFSKIGGIEEHILGGRLDGPITKMIHFTGSYKPMGWVTYSGARPLDGVVELNAFFDDINILKYTKDLKGNDKYISISPDKQISVSEFRNKVISDFVSAPNNIARNEILDKLDDQLGIIIGANFKFFDVEAIKKFTQVLKNHVFSQTDSLSKKGYAMDSQSHRIMSTAQTTKQLADSYRLSPWNIFEKELEKAILENKKDIVAINTKDMMQGFFEIANKWWSIDVLARPNYIVKNSWFEPSLSATMAHGHKIYTENIPSMTKNSIKNNRNRIAGVISKKYKGPELKAINSTISDLTEQYDRAIANLDILVSDLENFTAPSIIKPSPKAIEENKAQIVADVKAASKIVDSIELEIRDAVKPLGTTWFKTPSLSSLDRRIKFLETELSASEKAKFGATIANAKSALTKAKGSISTLAPNAKEIFENNKIIAKKYEEIDEITNSLGSARKERAEFFEKGPDYKKRYQGKESHYRMVEGQWIPIESLFSENQLGLAFKQEFSNVRTAAVTYLGEIGVGVRQGLMLRRGASTITNVNNPLYFEELAHFVNRSIRGEKLYDQILAGVPERDLIKWADTPAGKSYFNNFGISSQSEIPDIIRDRIGIVNRYLRKEEAKQAALKGDVTSIQLEKILAEDLRYLSPIHPLDFEAASAAEFGYRNLGNLEKAANKFAGNVFTFLTKFENPIRFASGDKFFADTIAQKANDYVASGGTFKNSDGTFNFNKLNVLRSSATKEALQLNEQTFYTTRRQNRVLAASRWATAFPTATLNAFYRYGRFALRNPERVSQFLYNYQAAFRSFGVDKYGAPTDDPLSATHLVVPLTKELGFFNGKGIRMNARAIGYILNYPTPSIFGSVLTAEIYKRYPEAEDMLKSALGSNYDLLFPYGPQTGFVNIAQPKWLNDFINYANGPEGKRDFNESWKDVYNYYWTLDDMGIQKYPGDEAVYRLTRDLFKVKSNWSFGNLTGVPVKVDTNPMAIYEDLYGMLVNKYTQQGADAQSAKDLAGSEMLSRLGENFPLSRVTFKGGTANTYILPNVKSFDRVMNKHGDLAIKLGNVAPELIGLMTLDIDPKEKFNLTVYNILKDPKTKLPDGSPLNDWVITPQEQDRRRKINEVWNQYISLTDKLEKVALSKDGKSLRSHPELLAIRTSVAEKALRKESESWWVQYNEGKFGDKSYTYAYALNSIINDKEFMNEHGNTKLWSDVQQFMAVRGTMIGIYDSLPDGDSRKAKVKNAYIGVLDKYSSQWHPALKNILVRYFSDDKMKNTNELEETK